MLKPVQYRPARRCLKGSRARGRLSPETAPMMMPGINRCTVALIPTRFCAGMLIVLGALLGLPASELSAQRGSDSLQSASAAKDNPFVLLEDSLVVLGDSLVRGSTYEVREAACVAFIPTLSRALRRPGSYDFPFSRVKTLSVVEAPDRSFRVFTFQMMLWDFTYRYFGAIQFKDAKKRPVALIDGSLFLPDSVLRTAVLDAEAWYGALYYGITAKKHKGTTYYLLFGWDALDLFSSRKLVEVLTFEDGKPVFGAPVLPEPGASERRINRFVMEFKREAAVTLNYDPELDLILFDHLVPENPLSEGIRSTYVPDGSYEGFSWDKGQWVYVEKVFHQTQAFPPDYTPARDPSQDPFNYERRLNRE
jgi:hypothetical protein